MTKTFYTKSQEETILLGEKLGSLIKNPPFLILLEGDLGAGKTTFTKGIGLSLGIKRIINSPTFTLLKIYDDTLYHMDLYRLNNGLTDFDLEEYIDSKICVIEWPNYDLLPNEYLLIKITIENDLRKIEFRPIGDKYKKILEGIL